MDIPRLLNELDNVDCLDQPLLLEPAQIVQAHRYKLKKQEMADLQELLAKVSRNLTRKEQAENNVNIQTLELQAQELERLMERFSKEFPQVLPSLE